MTRLCLIPLTEKIRMQALWCWQAWDHVSSFDLLCDSLTCRACHRHHLVVVMMVLVVVGAGWSGWGAVVLRLRTVIASLTTKLCTFSICKGSLFGRFWVPTLLSPMLDKAAKKHDQNAPRCCMFRLPQRHASLRKDATELQF